MKINLAYGKTGLGIELPDGLEILVIEPRYQPAIAAPQQALRTALESPLASVPLFQRAAKAGKVGIVFSDITRAAPHQLLLPAVLEQLAGVPRENMILFNALGTHRENTEVELRTMLGAELVEGYTLRQNNAFDAHTQVCLGTTSFGHEVWIDRVLAECDLKILTGFIEPHLFAGFSGGGKAIMPGMAGLNTILGNHSAQMIADPQATWGVRQGNPIFEEIREIAGMVSNSFLLNVALNKDQEITGIFAGDLDTAHSAGCEFVRRNAMTPVPHPYDIVITSNSGYPLDLNLYQAVKGMSAAAQIVKPGGAILIAAECWDGIPEHGKYRELLESASTPAELLERICTPGFLEQDQWQAQVQAQIQRKADIYVYAGGLTPQQIRAALLLPSSRIEDTVAALLAAYGPGASICVMPEGPQTIPYIA